jgi:hypothetical protein
MGARSTGSFGGALHDGDFLRRQAVEGVNQLVDLALQDARVGGGVGYSSLSASSVAADARVLASAVSIWAISAVVTSKSR